MIFEKRRKKKKRKKEREEEREMETFIYFILKVWDRLDVVFSFPLTFLDFWNYVQWVPYVGLTAL